MTTDFKFFPHYVVWETTFACNMRCIHCGTSAGKARPDELTTDEALKLIDELAGLGTEIITLSGGEPLLRKDWQKLALHAKSRGIKTAIISNGYAVTPEVVDQMQKVKFDQIGISFDGTRETHNYIRQRPDSFERAYAAMKMFSERGMKFCAVTQISNINLGELDAIRDLLVAIKCPTWRIQMTTATGRMKEVANYVLTIDKFPQFIDKLLELKKDEHIGIDVGENIGFYGCKGYELRDGDPTFGCFAGTRVAGIESNGDVKGCLSMPEQFVEGNIRKRSFTEIWNDPNFASYNRKFTRDTADGFCYDCKYLPLCRGGCATTSVSATGSRANNPFCTYRMEYEQGIHCEDPEYVSKALEPFKEAMAPGLKKAANT